MSDRCRRAGRYFASLAWSFLAPTFAAASPTTLPVAPPPGLDAALWERMKSVDAKSGAIADLTANFEQQKFTPLMKKPLISKGTLVAKGAGMLWDTRSPEPTVMRVDEKEVTLFYPKQKTAEVYRMGGKFEMITSFPVPR